LGASKNSPPNFVTLQGLSNSGITGIAQLRLAVQALEMARAGVLRPSQQIERSKSQATAP
jgi:hypothetical protein